MLRAFWAGAFFSSIPFVVVVWVFGNQPPWEAFPLNAFAVISGIGWFNSRDKWAARGGE